MKAMRQTLPLFACLLLLAAALPAAARRTAWLPEPASGRSLVTPSGERLFPSYLAMKLPGWLAEFGSSGMRIAYDGYDERRELPHGNTLLVLRGKGLLGAYVLRGDTCVGQLLYEPCELPHADATRALLRREGFRATRLALATADRSFGTEALDEIRSSRAGRDERLLVDLRFERDGQVVHMTCLGASTHVPAGLAASLGPLEQEGRTALAESCRQLTEHPPEWIFEQAPPI